MTDLAALLARIAIPRATGTPGNARVREILKAELAARGLVVMEHVFAVRASLALRGPRPATGVNLVAVRPRARVRAWLVAHYDSKGQPLSMAARLAGFTAVALAAFGGLVLFAAGSRWWGTVGLVAVLLGVTLVAANRVTDRSPGAIDNATGVLTALATLDALPPRAPVGVIFPDAEEWGLAGAHALARERAHLVADCAVFNFDGIDDRGRPTAFVHKRGAAAVAAASRAGARQWSWLPVVVDGLALASAARECVTLMKGGWGTMSAVHTMRDSAARLDLRGVREVSAAVAQALSRLESGDV